MKLDALSLNYLLEGLDRFLSYRKKDKAELDYGRAAASIAAFPDLQGKDEIFVTYLPEKRTLSLFARDVSRHNGDYFGEISKDLPLNVHRDVIELLYKQEKKAVKELTEAIVKREWLEEATMSRLCGAGLGHYFYE